MSDIMKQDNEDFRIGYVLCDAINEQARAEDIANARLIAAAPQLIMQLEIAASQLSLVAREIQAALIGTSGSAAFRDLISATEFQAGKSREVIAKATGL